MLCNSDVVYRMCGICMCNIYVSTLFVHQSKVLSIRELNYV